MIGSCQNLLWNDKKYKLYKLRTIKRFDIKVNILNDDGPLKGNFNIHKKRHYHSTM
jgi:hypothetical protein